MSVLLWFKLPKAEADAFKRKIKLRANDLACELVNEFLVEERACDEWNGVSKIGLPQTDPNDPGKVLLSPLATWADQKADELFANKPGKSAKDQSAFYFLEPDEMTFNKERNPDPPITEHHVKIFHVNEWKYFKNHLFALVNKFSSFDLPGSLFLGWETFVVWSFASGHVARQEWGKL